jgi:hypothetical protein
VGIKNIQILNETIEASDLNRRALQALEAQRIAEHQRGEHPWGSMRRDCPLCNPS